MITPVCVFFHITHHAECQEPLALPGEWPGEAVVSFLSARQFSSTLTAEIQSGVSCWQVREMFRLTPFGFLFQDK